MTKKEKLKELRRYFHVARELKEEERGKTDSSYFDGMMLAYRNAMELLLTPTDKKKINLYNFIWEDTSTN